MTEPDLDSAFNDGFRPSRMTMVELLSTWALLWWCGIAMLIGSYQMIVGIIKVILWLARN